MEIFQLPTIITLALFLAACNGEGGRRIEGVQCKRSYDPVPKKTEKLKVVSMEAAKQEMPVGTYVYEKSDLYYVDNSDFRIHVQETKQKDGSFKGSTVCVRNAVPGMQGLAMSVEGISGLTVDTSTKATLADTKQYGFKIEDRILPDIKAAREKLSESPSIIYESKSEYYMIQHSETSFEVRSFGQSNHGTYSLSVQFKRQ